MGPERQAVRDGDPAKCHAFEHGELRAMQELLACHSLRSDVPYATVWLDLFSGSHRWPVAESCCVAHQADPCSAAAEWINSGFRDPELIRDAQLLGCDAAAALHALEGAGLKVAPLPQQSARATPTPSDESQERARLRALLERNDTG